MQITPQWFLESSQGTSGKNGLTRKDDAWNQPLNGVSIDTRTLKKGEMFIALSGENFDGHQFIEQAIKNGAAAIMIEKLPKKSVKVPIIKVKSTQTALEQCAHHWRKQVNPHVIAITGSSGKTSVKEMLANCRTHEITQTLHATEGNFNNHIGLPLTLLRMPSDCRIVVLEMGMSAKGEIKKLCRIAEPDTGVITNIAPAHLGNFASVEEIAEAKAELLENLSPKGRAILPKTSPYFPLLQKKSFTRFHTFALSPKDKSTFYCKKRVVKQGKNHITLQGPKFNVKMQPAGFGEHTILNVLAATAAAYSAGISPKIITKAINTLTPSHNRGSLKKSSQGWQVFDDSYNANPASMEAALQALQTLAPKKHRIAILGDMLELGKESEALHQGLAKAILQAGIQQLFVVGSEMQALTNALSSKKLKVHTLKSADCDPNQVIPHLKKRDVILIKGSRGMHLEQLVQKLL
ncbi:UDP-N-acetylmuramoyl-tripeptide--D-alanyl-D-alanine ligase [Magnetococcales bacterium HHB-1]